ncbi:MAG TPA: hypothetical protein VL728_08920 [Cyclobacteriaceae bacterium]|jgi:hypothetical protein|nr:hypothetical protein [Cyclobacteriaceae bacterium]
MIRPLNTWRVVGLATLIVALALACQHDDSQNLLGVKMQQSNQAAQDNSVMIASAQDVVSTTASAFSSQGLTFGRFAEHGDDNDSVECKPTITSTVTITRLGDSTVISGKLIIDFGTICTDTSEMKKGKIIDSIYVVLSKTVHRASEFVAFDNYWRDSTSIDGSFSITSGTGQPTVVKISGTKVRYKDGSSSSWTGDLTFTTEKSGVGNSYTASMTATGSWGGVTRSGTSFSGNITKDVVFKAGCFGHRHKFMPVSGTIDIVTSGVTSTIDFGDGTCDRTYTITSAGQTTTHHLG